MENTFSFSRRHSRKYLVEAGIRWTCLCLLLQIGLTPALWFPQGYMNRKLPNILTFSFISIPPTVYDLFTEALTSFCVASLVLNCVKLNRLLIGGQTAGFIVLIILDYLRMQTWLYIYIFVFIVYFFFHRSKVQLQNAIFLLQIITGGVWFWSGFLKFNASYPYGDFNFMMFGLPVKYLSKTWLFIAAFLSGFIELFAGAGAVLFAFHYIFDFSFMKAEIDVDSRLFSLLSYFIFFFDPALRMDIHANKIEKIKVEHVMSVLVPNLAILMHIFIIVRLTMEWYEISVLPWNFAFIGYAHLFLFEMRPLLIKDSKNEESLVDSSTTFRMMFLLICVMFLILPLGCLFNVVDPYYSFGMYTTNDPYIAFVLPSSADENRLYMDNDFPLPSARSVGVRKRAMISPFNIFQCVVEEPCTYCNDVDDLKLENMMSYSIDSFNWGFHDTGAAIQPSLGLYRDLASRFCKDFRKYIDRNVQSSGLRFELENTRIYIADKVPFPFTAARDATEYKCGAGGELVILKANLCETP